MATSAAHEKDSKISFLFSIFINFTTELPVTIFLFKPQIKTLIIN